MIHFDKIEVNLVKLPVLRTLLYISNRWGLVGGIGGYYVSKGAAGARLGQIER